VIVVRATARTSTRASGIAPSSRFGSATCDGARYAPDDLRHGANSGPRQACHPQSQRTDQDSIWEHGQVGAAAAHSWCSSVRTAGGRHAATPVAYRAERVRPLASERRENGADKQEGDLDALDREGDPRGGVQSDEHRHAGPREIVDDEGVAMSGPAGAPQEGESVEERRAGDRSD
jgi:hypothetical protein